MDLDTFRTYARDRRVIPVSRTLLADGVTAVGLYDAMCGTRAGTFLLESAEQGRTWSRYSFIGVRSAAMLTVRDGSAQWVGRVPEGIPTQGSPTEVLRATVEALRTEPLPDLPPLTGGMVGYLSYDMVRAWEQVPDTNPDELGVPDMAFLLATDLAVVDHANGTVTLIANAINFDNSDARVDDAWADAVARLDAMQALLAAPHARQAHTYDASAPPQITNRTAPGEFEAQVERAKEYIRAGDAFQIVVSQRFSSPCSGDALDVYRMLRTSNPSPYMYLLRLPSTDTHARRETLDDTVAFEIVGSSPEALVTVTDGRCTVHPIAGTRPRGATPEQDIALGDELLADVKERAEHVMLVDLARNDLGRVCAAGSVDVVQFMSVERYSHVMHLVSTVVGDLASGYTAFDALAATFPAGTLSGAPKPRAMAIIDELEPVRRGVYGGCIGYLDFAGNVDAAITIRTAVIIGGTAYVQAGAGIVADSDPAAENAECVNKAAAVLRAVAVGATLRPVN
jgi:anthranilate synthase component 1